MWFLTHSFLNNSVLRSHEIRHYAMTITIVDHLAQFSYPVCYNYFESHLPLHSLLLSIGLLVFVP